MIFLQKYKKKNNVFNIFGSQIPNITVKLAFTPDCNGKTKMAYVGVFILLTFTLVRQRQNSISLVTLESK